MRMQGVGEHVGEITHDQPELPFGQQPRKLRRGSDPDTSHEAAERLGGSAQRRRLLEVYRAPHTYEEASVLAGLNPWQASKRTSDLINLGLAAWSGEYRDGSTGRRQRVIVITQAGNEALGR